MKFLYVSALMVTFTLGQALGQGATGAASFLSRGMGARGISLGSAYAAIVDDASAVYWNPAGLTYASRFHVMVSDLVDIRVSSSFGEIQYPQLAMSLNRTRPLFGIRRLAVGLGYAGFLVQDITNYDKNANYLGNSDFSESAVFLSLATQIRAMRIGMSWKYFKQDFTGATSFSQTTDLSSMGKPHDFGIIIEPVSWLKIGLVIRDSVRIGSFDCTPREAQMGFGLDIGKLWQRVPVQISVDLRGVSNDADRLLIGFEYRGSLGNRELHARLGLNTVLANEQSSHLSRDAKVAFGFGIRGNYLGLDIGWLQEIFPNLLSPYSTMVVVTTNVSFGRNIRNE